MFRITVFSILLIYSLNKRVKTMTVKLDNLIFSNIENSELKLVELHYQFYVVGRFTVVQADSKEQAQEIIRLSK